MVTGSGPDAEQRALEKYWTPERMRTAHPADELMARTSQAKTGTGQPRTRIGQPDKIAPTRPAVDIGLPERINPDGPVGGGLAASQRRSFAPNLPPTNALARTYGKVFFTNATDGLSYVCSATVVNSIRRDTLWTAGHCVHGGPGGTWHQDWHFVPAFDNGIGPFGAWTAERLATRPDWIASGDLSEDFGMVVVAPRDGRRIVDVLGGQGIAWNLPPSYFASSFGYPQAPPFDGKKLIGCKGTANPGDIDIINVINLPCDMTGGSSGGGWLREVSQGLGYLNGLNSFGVVGIPDVMFSPYYGDGARSLYYEVVNEV
jgi:hypothetical protein